MIQERKGEIHASEQTRVKSNQALGGGRVTGPVRAIILHVTLAPTVVACDILHVAAATASTALSSPTTTTPAGRGSGGDTATLVNINIGPLTRPIKQRIVQTPENGQPTMARNFRVQQLCNTWNFILCASLDPRQYALQY